MQTPGQRCARIVAAFEDLAAQEEASLQVRDFAALEEIQDRAALLVADLVTHAAAADSALRQRISAVQVRRGRSSDWLAQEIELTRTSLHETNCTQRRVARIAPVYGSTPAAARVPSQLNAIG